WYFTWSFCLCSAPYYTDPLTLGYHPLYARLCCCSPSCSLYGFYGVKGVCSTDI
ncbi:hypothetical protein G9C98_007661, partial [Cotesia typhae]